MSTLTKFLKRLGSLAGDDADALIPPLGEEMGFDATDIYAYFKKPAPDGMAATVTAATKGVLTADTIQGGFTNPYDFDLLVVGFTISPNAALVADPANFATIIVETDDALDAVPVAAFSLASTIALPGSNTWATDIPQIVSGFPATTKGVPNAAGQRLRPGASLFIEITKTAAGVVVPACAICVRMRRL